MALMSVKDAEQRLSTLKLRLGDANPALQEAAPGATGDADSQAADSEIAELKRLLADVIAAGERYSETSERIRLKRVAREISDLIWSLREESVGWTILPYEEKADSASRIVPPASHVPRLRRLVRYVAGVAACGVALVLVLAVASKLRQPSLEVQRRTAIQHSRELILACQLDDGAYRMSAEGDKVWINPYFANRAALALLATLMDSPDARYREQSLASVRKWLSWYAAHLSQDSGTIPDFVGSLGLPLKQTLTDNPAPCAASFLLLADRYYAQTGSLSPDVRQAAKRALQVIQANLDPEDGLYFVKQKDPPHARLKYLLSNVEVLGGLLAGQGLFQALGDEGDAATVAQRLSRAMAPRLAQYWRPANDLFASCKVDDQWQVALTNLSPDVLSNLAGVAWINSRTESVWRRIQSEFAPDDGRAAAAPVEWWLLAAGAAGDSANIDFWTRRTLKTALEFTFRGASDHTVYIDRPANVILVLTGGRSYLPSIAGTGGSL